MEKKSEPKENDNSVWDCGSPLYDSYELASFGHVLERHTMALPHPCRPSGQFRIISNKPEGSEGRFERKMSQLLGVGLFRKVVKWTLRKMMKIRPREGTEKDKKLLSGFYSLCKQKSQFVQSKKLEN